MPILFLLCRMKKASAKSGPHVVTGRLPSQHHSILAKDASSFVRSYREHPTTTTFTEDEPHDYTTVRDDSHNDTDEFGYLYTSALQRYSTSQPGVPRHYPPVPRTEEAREMGESLEDTEQYEVMLATANNPAYKNVAIMPTPHAAGIYDRVP